MPNKWQENGGGGAKVLCIVCSSCCVRMVAQGMHTEAQFLLSQSTEVLMCGPIDLAQISNGVLVPAKLSS